MAIANFFDKVALSASQLLKDYDREAFEKLLLNENILIHFDNSAVETFEGRELLKLLVNMLARLYPNLCINNTESEQLRHELEEIAKAINPVIELHSTVNPTVAIAVGKSACRAVAEVFYVGSDNWNVHFSRQHPVVCGKSNNPIGAGAAACFGAANIFRSVFRAQLPHSALDADFIFSMLELRFDPETNGSAVGPLNLDDLTLIGVGAVGNGFIWAISKWNELSGRITLIDHDPVALSNLQRYILTDQDSINAPKPELAAKFLESPTLEVIPETREWADWVNTQNSWRLNYLAIAVDNVKDRILIQGSLPRRIYNAWTQQENLGVSRHNNFLAEPCLACLYFPQEEKKSISQEIADALNIGANERVVREYIANHMPLDERLLRLISEKNNISTDQLAPFCGKPVQTFYSDVVCGGILMRLNPEAGNNANTAMQVPAVFESVFAGILLASELIIAENNYATRTQNKSDFNLMRPLSQYINSNSTKVPGCICGDENYRQVYIDKYLSDKV